MERNYSIDYMRVICSLFVIGIHTNVFCEFSETVSTIITQCIGKMAVPFFFVVSGYFYSTKIMLTKNPGGVFLHNAKHIIKLYTIWTAVILPQIILRSILHHISLKSFVHNLLFQYFVGGITEPMWFFPALFWSMILVTVGYQMNKRTPFFIVCSLFLYGLLVLSQFSSKHIVFNVINSECFIPYRRIFLIGLPHFIAGTCLAFVPDFCKELNTKWLNFMLLMALSAAFVETIFVFTVFNRLDVAYLPFRPFLISTTFLFLLAHPAMQSKNVFFKNSRDLATFIYLFHPIVIDGILFANHHLLPTPFSETMRFAATVIICLAAGYCVIKSEQISELLLK